MSDCGCGAAGSTNSCGRRYMRIDDVIVDKKYISRIEFQDEYFHIWYAGNCQPVKYPLLTPKSANQVAEYTLELNSCGEQEDMATDDHTKLFKLDVEDQHPIKAIISLQDELDNRVKYEEIAWLKGSSLYNTVNYSYEFNGVDPKTVSVTGLIGIPSADVLFSSLIYDSLNDADISTIILTEDTKERFLDKGLSLKALHDGIFFSLTVGPLTQSISFTAHTIDLWAWTVGTTNPEQVVFLNQLMVKDDLNSTQVDLPLSANQGKVLNDKINNLYLIPECPEDGRLYARRKSNGVATWVVIG